MSLPSIAQLKSSLSPRQFQLIVLPTEQCNFRCDYCYEDFSIGRMAPQTVAAVKAFVSRRARGLDALKIEWFGGEPLAAKDIVFDISQHAQQVCHENNVVFSGSTTTNGYFLSTPLAAEMARLGQTRYQITLDGDKDCHDKTRKLAAGGATFERIWANLAALRDSSLPVSVQLRLHLTNENFGSMKQLAAKLRDELLGDSRFSTLIRAVENLGGPNAASIKPLSHDESSRRTREINDILYPGNGTISPPPKAPLDICYASRPNSIVIRANGKIQKCTVALGSEDNTVGHLDATGAINLDPRQMQLWMRGYANESESELRCPAHHFPYSKRATIEIKQIP
jgi:uncharacterized protein